jgi:hypothetical protein
MDKNIFDIDGYSSEPVQVESQSDNTSEGQTTNAASTEGETQTEGQVALSNEGQSDGGQSSEVQTGDTANEGADGLTGIEPKSFEFEWNNEESKSIYESLINGDFSSVSDMLYEQKLLSNLKEMDDSDAVMMSLAYQYPDLTPEEIREEFDSRYGVTKEDTEYMSEDELASYNKKLEKETKRVERELKKDARVAKETLSSYKKDISFPDIISKAKEFASVVDPKEYVNQYIQSEQTKSEQTAKAEREKYLSQVDKGLNEFTGFEVKYKDEEVSIDAKFSIPDEDKISLKQELNDFDLVDYFGNRYVKDDQYDTRQIAEDKYFLQNRDKIINSLVTQAVSKAKLDWLKSIKGIDLSSKPSIGANPSANDEVRSASQKIFNF